MKFADTLNELDSAIAALRENSRYLTSHQWDELASAISESIPHAARQQIASTRCDECDEPVGASPVCRECYFAAEFRDEVA